ncbi:MAG TPA: Na+/H+ antiporter subunit E [Bacteroidales bacterium]|nr:Na+/H+ antiporter subunit E [Bacteroidales bacterium]
MRILKKIYYILYLTGFYLVKLTAANLYIAWDIITPRMHTNPGIIEVETGSKSDVGLLLLSNLVSMTPGTLSIDIDPSKEKLKVHVLYMNRKEDTLKEIEKIREMIKKIID